MSQRIETVVFVIEDAKAAEPFWAAFKNRAAIYGMRPIACGIGDQMTTPSEIADELRFMDADNIDRGELKRLIKMAQEWDSKAMASTDIAPLHANLGKAP